jgi:hypothetical protein
LTSIVLVEAHCDRGDGDIGGGLCVGLALGLGSEKLGLVGLDAAAGAWCAAVSHERPFIWFI